MPTTNSNCQPEFEIRRTNVKTPLTPEATSPLGKELMKIAREIENSDEPAFDKIDVERELEKRRGGFVKNGE